MDMSSMTSSMSMAASSTMSMDHGTMDHAAMTNTAAAASATSTGMSMDHGGMGMGNGCKISMLWNWNTVDSCFISERWHVTSKGMFAGSCIGVVLLVIALEFLRRAGKEYDRFLTRKYQAKLAGAAAITPSSPTESTEPVKGGAASNVFAKTFGPTNANEFRPNVMEQAIRSLLHMLAFAVAYFVMLLAMYYNGYFIICIFIGAFLGFFIFGWEKVSVAGPKEDVTVCCG